jgi:hypothetical protein
MRGPAIGLKEKQNLNAEQREEAIMKSVLVRSAGILLGLVLSTAPLYAETLRGTWSGSGYVKPTDGQREKVSCRVIYSPAGASTVNVQATCTSQTTTVHQTGQLTMVSPTRYIGDFYNQEYDISGRIRVSTGASSQTVTFSGARGSGSLNLRRN